MSLLYHNDTIIKKEKELLRALLIQFCKLEFDLPIFLKSHVELLFHLPRYALLTLTFHCALLISKHWKFTHYKITGDHILSEIIM